jgi:non-heme Fe2+,alpha-ketoglutarate-dependent halogenase
MASAGGLTQEQVRQYQERGYLGPFDLFSKSEADRYKQRIRKELHELDRDVKNLEGVHPLALRHLDSPTVYDLCTRDEIVDKMAAVYGQDLLLWESKLFYKEPGGPAIPWHQHYHHMATIPKMSITAWVALDDCTEENGCLEVIPRSNRRPIPEVEAPEEVVAKKMADPDRFEETEAITLELEAGQYVLFSENALHRSFENTSDSYRRALAVRAVPPNVRVDPELYGRNPDVENHSAILISGEDEYEINELMQPPEKT